MERRRLVDILPTSKILLNIHLATSRRRSILNFRLPNNLKSYRIDQNNLTCLPKFDTFPHFTNTNKNRFPMPQPQEINIRQLLDRSPISFYQKLIIALCFFIVVADGFDVAIMGFVAPYIKADWQLTNNALAPVLSAALAGLAVGAMITGPLADKFGRRKVLLGNVLCFGCATLLVAHAGPAREYNHPDYIGNIGIIAPYSKDFCTTCNRLRITAQGKMHLCLFGSVAHDLRPYLHDVGSLKNQIPLFRLPVLHSALGNTASRRFIAHQVIHHRIKLGNKAWLNMRAQQAQCAIHAARFHLLGA